MGISDELYELCLPVLKDDGLEDEDKTEKMEEVLRKDTALSGKALEDVILDAMWRWRGAKDGMVSPPPPRHTIVRKSSPAPWQLNRTPTPSVPSPRIGPPPGFGIAPPAFTRAKSSTAISPFTSPRPSPRLAVATPHIPHSPSLNAYEFSSQPSPNTDEYGDFGSDTVDWLVNDDAASNASSPMMNEGSLNGAAAEWVPDHMDVYDLLRSIIREDRSNEELERILEANSYDLSSTVSALMEGSAVPLQAPSSSSDVDRTYLVGKSMTPTFRPSTPVGQGRTPVMCKYWLQTGHCARADCRFSHDPSKTICKYWLNGNCLAGDTCLFSHDASVLMSRMMIEGAATPPTQTAQPNFQVQDYESFPLLQRTASGSSTQLYQSSLEPTALEQLYGTAKMLHMTPPGLNPFPAFGSRPSSGAQSRPNSRPVSRQGNRSLTPSAPALDDADAYPTLASAAAAGKGGKKHHGKRGHGHSHKENGHQPSSLADVVRMSPSPSSAASRKGLRTSNRNSTCTRENSAAAMAIPQPEQIPWLETGEAANKTYMKARQEAFKHGGMRNKFLQSAAQAWNRNDTRAAKALSLRGQTENNLMKEAHREAARILYEERNKDSSSAISRELYVDLHGLHPDEAISYLSEKLLLHQSSPRPLYAITGTGHHSKGGRDKVNKAVRAFLNDWRYAFREFSVPGDRNNVGGILGVDPSSYDRAMLDKAVVAATTDAGGADDSGGLGAGVAGIAQRAGESTKVRVLRREDVEREADAAADGEGDG